MGRHSWVQSLAGVAAIVSACAGGNGMRLDADLGDVWDGGAADSVDSADSGGFDTRADATCGTTATPLPGLVVTAQGAVQGTQRGSTWVYLGIPYAAPPVGAARWRPPGPPACASFIRDGSN